ncbi:MAG: amidohydrolase [Actinobacteria bacterium]|nr:amidohydrolase [Actinomycetota bacterium]MBU1494792.1 amidohydrolase [Actinomycetota bacterium]
MTDRLIVATSVSGPDDADAILVRDGRIAAVGREQQLDDGSRPVERHVGVITPAFCDAHLHPVGYASVLHRPSLMNAAGFDEVADILAAAAAASPEGSAVTAMRLNDETLAEACLPDRHLLDRAVPDRPVFVVRYCGHVAVANTRALEMAGIGPDTPDPEGGSIDRDERGMPTGILRETANEIVSGALADLAPPVTREHLIEAAASLASLGLASVGGIVDIREGCWSGAASELDALIDAAPDLPIRVGALVVAHTPEELEEAARRLAEAGPMVGFLGLKAFADGSFGGHTAAMAAPYADRADRCGTHRLEPAWGHRMAWAALRLGGRVAIHAIGDAANGRVLDVMERLIDEGADPAMLRIEHASVLTDDDLARFGRLGITAVVQPAFLASEADWLETRVGPERLSRTYAFRSLRDAGVPLAGSSDCPVEPPHPLWGMAAARDRCGLVPEQALPAGAAHDLFTSGAAAAIGESRSLEPGSAADLVVIDGDPIRLAADGLRDARVVATYVDGSPVRFPQIAPWPD